MAKITFSRPYTCMRAYVRTNLIDVDLRESTAVRDCDFSYKCSFVALMALVTIQFVSQFKLPGSSPEGVLYKVFFMTCNF